MLKYFAAMVISATALTAGAAGNMENQLGKDDPIVLTGLLDVQPAKDSSDLVELPQPDTTLIVDDILFPRYFFGRPVYSGFNIRQPEKAAVVESKSQNSPLYWIQREKIRTGNMGRISQNMMFSHPEVIIYNEELLPEPPKVYIATADPSSAHIDVKEKPISISEVKDAPKKTELKYKDWLSSFNGNVQFSQAYISPNWYQGGNNNLNALISAVYNIKLNQAFHPNLLFDNTVQYKLGLASAPDDEMRNYSISEDLFQVNTQFGVKAWKRWFYSMNAQFKTQMFNNYKKNTNDMIASFLSPGELNLGVGMTYDYTNPKKTLTFKASISPFSYNLKMCTSNRVDPTAFGIEEGRHYASEYGSNLEAKLSWKVCHNITYSSRLFAFTDYDYLQGDWENTVQFDINRFLSTQLYVHVRYDSQTASIPDSQWHRWQVKEILSFGFSYRFATPGM